MWIHFFLCLAVSAVLLYAPGFLLLAGFRQGRMLALAAAPLISIALYEILAILYGALGIFSSWMSIFLPSILFGLVVFAACFASRHYVARCERVGVSSKTIASSQASRFSPRMAALVLLYVLVGLGIVFWIFVKNLDGPSSILQEYDNVRHLGSIATFLSSGDYSPLHSSLYTDSEAVSISPFSQDGAFYPSAWHCLVALVVGMTGFPMGTAVNALNTLLAGVVFPLGMLSVLLFIFRGKEEIAVCGSVCVLAFAAFPWGFLLFGPLYPNLLSFSLVPAVAYVFMLTCSSGMQMKLRLVTIVVFCICMIALALSHPNGVFTLAVFVAPYCVYRVMDAVSSSARFAPHALRCRIVAGALSTLGIIAIWTLCYKAPFLQAVIANTWGAVAGIAQAVQSVALVSYAPSFLFYDPGFYVVQAVLAVCVVAGLMGSLVMKKYRWMLFSFLFAAVIFVVDVSTDGFLKHYLSGFWYTDKFRTAALLALVSIPIATFGMWMIAYMVRKAMEDIGGKLRIPAASTLVIPALLVAFVSLNYSFNWIGQDREEGVSAFEAISNTIAQENIASEEKPYSKDEQDFVARCLEVIPEGALVINVPNDGSVFAYSLDGMNVRYRYFHGYGGSDETENSLVIRQSLSDIAEDDSVKQAVSDIGAEYVLKLDVSESRPLLPYDENDWIGITPIQDDTQGFEVVLSEGDMRLYRIES